MYGAFATFADSADREALLERGGPKMSSEMPHLFRRTANLRESRSARGQHAGRAELLQRVRPRTQRSSCPSTAPGERSWRCTWPCGCAGGLEAAGADPQATGGGTARRWLRERTMARTVIERRRQESGNGCARDLTRGRQGRGQSQHRLRRPHHHLRGRVVAEFYRIGLSATTTGTSVYVSASRTRPT